MNKRSVAFGMAIALAMGSLSRASVDYTYVARDQSISPTPEGFNDTVNLYLQEVSTAGSFAAASDGGLYSGGVALVEQPGGTGATFSSSGVSNNSLLEPNGFTGNNTHGLIAGGGAWIADITNNAANVGVAPVSTTSSNGTTINLYLLGSVTIGVNDNPDFTVLVESLHDAPTNHGAPAAGADGNTLTFTSGYDLDWGLNVPGGAIGADGQPTAYLFGPVPEPASAALFGAGAICLLAHRRRAS